MEQFPPNSQKAKAADHGPKQVKQVTSAEVKRRRRPLGKQFAHTFFGGDAKTALGYMIESVIIPATQEAIVEAFSSGVEKIVYGDRGGRRRGAPSAPSPYGRVNYNQQSMQHPAAPQPRGISRGGKARHDFGELVIQRRNEAEDVLGSMFDILSQYDVVVVADLYELCGIAPSHTDHKWGWRDLTGAKVGRVRGGGYLLDLPQPEPLSR